MNEVLINLITEIVKKELNIKANVDKIKKNKVKVGISARHVHLSKEDLELLFGIGYALKLKKNLMGEQYAAEETVTLLGNKLKAIEKVRILGPVRNETQVEISYTDAIYLGIKAPVRLSGNMDGAASITIVGPKGVIRKNVCIVAKRHIHMSSIDANMLGIDEGIVSVKINGERAGILNNVDVRVRDDYHLEMHIDTDEANALGIGNSDFVEIIR